MLNANWQLHFIFEVALTPKVNSAFQTMHGYVELFLLFFLKRFDLFITRAVAANGGLQEEVVVV